MHRTVDSIFALKPLIDKYVKSKSQKHRNLLFSCFVDFRKAFDCIPQQKLFDELRKEGVQGHFLDVLISIYSNDTSAVNIENKFRQSFTCKGKVACSHLLFLISIVRTTHITMDMSFTDRGTHKTSVSQVGEKISAISVSQEGEYVTLSICVSWVGEHISLRVCVSHVRKSLGICVSQVREHISLGIRVSQVGEHASLGVCFPGGRTHFTRDMCSPGGGTHITWEMCFPGRGTHITRDMCLPDARTHITRDMCFPGGGNTYH